MYLGVDVGSVSTDIVLLDEELKVLDKHYLKTQGSPVRAVQEGLLRVRRRFGDARVKAAGATGSGRQVAAAVMGADAVKNEITAHAVAALHLDPGVRTVIEIGGRTPK
jgi:activator of 2-hydroxyglutaryl-CoA dehydratase